MSKVFILDTNKQPLNPVHPGRARMLLSHGKAAVLKRYPFTIILKCAVKSPVVESLRIKLDPGSKITGIAIVNDTSGEVVFGAELTHRGEAIKKRLQSRRGVRRGRRQRHTRYRQPRFDNRCNKKNGWIAPSLESRVCNVVTWVKRLMRVCPINALSQEREYLLEKWRRQCAYCGKTDVPLEVEHINPCSKSRDDRVCNLTLACEPCNNKKGKQDIRVFLAKNPDLLERILAQAKAPLKHAAAVNITRWILYEQLKALGVSVECSSGGRTKYNRVTRGLEKAHWLDASCVGASTPEHLHIAGVVPLLIAANGYGSRQMCLMDKRGFPRTGPKQAKRVKGFQTGDMVKAVVTSGVKRGTYVGRESVRATGSFNITTKEGKTLQGISHRHCTVLQTCDGYSYKKGEAAFPPAP